MKTLSSSQINAVSGALGILLTGQEVKNFGEFLTTKLGKYLASRSDIFTIQMVGCKDSGLKQDYLDWCKQSNIDAESTAKLHGWKL